MKRFEVSPSLVISLVALFVALGGGAYAALGPNSVGPAQLKRGAVTSKALRQGSVVQAKIRAGAVGATTLVVKESRIVFPGDEEYPDQSLVAPLKNYFRMDDGDVIIIGSAFNYDAAEKGAVTAALSLGNLARRCWSEGTSILSHDTEADELRCLALAIHELLGRLPVTMRSRNRPGVRCEDGEVIDTHYTGPMLEESMKRGSIVRRLSTSGPYRGLPIIAVPIMRKREAIACMATIDLGKGTYSDLLAKLAERY